MDDREQEAADLELGPARKAAVGQASPDRGQNALEAAEDEGEDGVVEAGITSDLVHEDRIEVRLLQGRGPVAEGQLHDLRDRVRALRDLLVVPAHRLRDIDGERAHEPVHVTEEAVDGPGRRADRIGDPTGAHRRAALTMQQLRRRREQRRPRLFPVLLRSTHSATLTSQR